MALPRYCKNPACEAYFHPPAHWLCGDGSYETAAHGTVRRFRCRLCGARLSTQSESMHYYAKRHLDLKDILSRVRGGASLRDIGRTVGCSRTAVANAVVRLGRQAIACHCALMQSLPGLSSLVFDGLVSAVGSRDYPCQINTLVDATTEMVLTMTHCVTERGGRRTAAQSRRIVKCHTPCGNEAPQHSLQ